MMTDDEMASLRERLASAESLIRVHRLIWRQVYQQMPIAAKAIDDWDYFPVLFDADLSGVLSTFMTGKELDSAQVDFLRLAPNKLSQLADRMIGYDKSYFLRYIKIVNAVVQHVDRFGSASKQD